MKKIIIASIFASLLAVPAMAETVRMGTEGAYPPYNFINDKNEVDGFEREVGDELCMRANLDCVWVVNDWDSIIPNLVSGNYDTIIAGMSITAERDEVIDFTQEYFPPSPSMYVALAGGSVNISGGVIAAQTGTIQAGHVASSGATLVEFATPDETIAAVRNGEADAVLADGDYLMPIVDESGGELAVVGQVGIGGGIGMGIRESDTELKGKMDAAIASMKSDGTLNTMIKKWFGDDALTF
ncbi:MAG: transporter substrate-binding domain-containing protein [Alphaproteobacteria bacterium]|nr:transporter substrate-binding domain-containing protein [Alphaproteobacteria bacterium]